MHRNIRQRQERQLINRALKYRWEPREEKCDRAEVEKQECKVGFKVQSRKGGREEGRGAGRD